MNRVRQHIHHIRNFFRGAGFSPQTDWRVALMVFVVFLILISILSSLMFLKFSSKPSTDTVIEATGVEMIDRDTLKEVAGYFKDRSVSARPDASILVDPSR
jgi:regulatory protein YycI of two-component signal transduction system YycFG